MAETGTGETVRPTVQVLKGGEVSADAVISEAKAILAPYQKNVVGQYMFDFLFKEATEHEKLFRNTVTTVQESENELEQVMRQVSNEDDENDQVVREVRISRSLDGKTNVQVVFTVGGLSVRVSRSAENETVDRHVIATDRNIARPTDLSYFRDRPVLTTVCNMMAQGRKLSSSMKPIIGPSAGFTRLSTRRGVTEDYKADELVSLDTKSGNIKRQVQVARVSSSDMAVNGGLEKRYAYSYVTAIEEPDGTLTLKAIDPEQNRVTKDREFFASHSLKEAEDQFEYVNETVDEWLRNPSNWQ